MKKIFVIAVIVTSSLTAYAQKAHIIQSTPFENVLRSMKTDSVSLFMNAFSSKIIGGEKDEKVWLSRLNQGKEKFKNRFGAFQPSDFSYSYEKKESKLIIYFKGMEQHRMSVIKEGKAWKLNEK